MLDFTIYEKNEKRADELQRKYGLTETLHDLYAWETLTEEEVIKLQSYKNKVLPKYTGNYDTDLVLTEAFEKKLSTLNLTEAMLTNSCARELYEGGCLELHEALELQKLRALKS
jgi:hypothetical protein